MLALKRIVAVAFLSCSAALAQAGTQATRESERIDHLMNFHVRLETAAPPGWSIEVKPVSLQRGPNDTVGSRIHLFIHGAPAGTLFEQQTVDVGSDQPTSVLNGITAGNDGILMCAGRTQEQCGDAKNPDDPIDFTANSIAGEPIRFLFVSAAGTISTVIVPYPVAKRDKGCAVSAVRLTPGFDVALITGTGYPPLTDIPYAATSAATEQHIRTDARGVFRMAVVPGAKPGQKNGLVKLKVKMPTCSPEISYPWTTQ